VKRPAPLPIRSVPLPSGKTRFVAILGWPLTYTLSPRLHNAALRRHGLDAVYLALPSESPASFRALARGLMLSPGFVGANITNPHKLSACALGLELSPAARAIGAVNTLARGPKGSWVGHNTDAAGFLEALRLSKVRVKGARVLVLGAGGAARAAVWAGAQAGARRIVVLARRRAQARATAALAGNCGLSGDLVEGSAALASVGADLVVNSLPGEALGGRFGACLARRAKKGAAAMDLSYSPPRTAFLHEAGLRGWREIPGLDMLVEQGREAFALWFGFKPERRPSDLGLRKV
jgi:shikimate dehydrogenase